MKKGICTNEDIALFICFVLGRMHWQSDERDTKTGSNNAVALCAPPLAAAFRTLR